MPLDDIAAVIVHAHGVTFSVNLVAALAEHDQVADDARRLGGDVDVLHRLVADRLVPGLLDGDVAAGDHVAVERRVLLARHAPRHVAPGAE